MKNSPLILLGSGRSGTTLIQRIMNTFPNIMIWGEHAGFLKQLSDIYFFLRENPSLKEYSYQQTVENNDKFSLSMYNDSKVWQAWINWFRPEDIDGIFRRIVESFFSPEEFEDLVVWGFKEIRYGPDDQVIQFLCHIYPEANFLIISRDSLNTIESQVTTFHKGSSKFTKLKRFIRLPQLVSIAHKWQVQNAYYLHLTTTYPDTFYLIRYEDALEDLTLLDPVLEKYGLSIGDEQQQILSMKEGRGTGFKKNDKVNLRWRRMGLIPAFISEILVGETTKALGYERPKQLSLATKMSNWITRRKVYLHLSQSPKQ